MSTRNSSYSRFKTAVRNGTVEWNKLPVQYVYTLNEINCTIIIITMKFRNKKKNLNKNKSTNDKNGIMKKKKKL